MADADSRDAVEAEVVETHVPDISGHDAGADEPKAKRARVGRLPIDILRPIEADVEPTAGRVRQLRLLVLHAGESRRYGDSVARTLQRQAAEFSGAFQSEPDMALDILFEGVLSLPHLLPLLATIVGSASCHATFAEHRAAAGSAAAAAAAARDADGDDDLTGNAATAAPPAGAAAPPPLLPPHALMTAVCERLHRHLRTALATGHPLHARLLTRFLGSLASTGAVSVNDGLAQARCLVVDSAAAALADALALCDAAGVRVEGGGGSGSGSNSGGAAAAAGHHAAHPHHHRASATATGVGHAHPPLSPVQAAAINTACSEAEFCVHAGLSMVPWLANGCAPACEDTTMRLYSEESGGHDASDAATAAAGGGGGDVAWAAQLRALFDAAAATLAGVDRVRTAVTAPSGGASANGGHAAWEALSGPRQCAARQPIDASASVSASASGVNPSTPADAARLAAAGETDTRVLLAALNEALAAHLDAAAAAAAAASPADGAGVPAFLRNAFAAFHVSTLSRPWEEPAVADLLRPFIPPPPPTPMPVEATPAAAASASDTAAPAAADEEGGGGGRRSRAGSLAAASGGGGAAAREKEEEDEDDDEDLVADLRARRRAAGRGSGVDHHHHDALSTTTAPPPPPPPPPAVAAPPRDERRRSSTAGAGDAAAPSAAIATSSRRKRIQPAVYYAVTRRETLAPAAGHHDDHHHDQHSHHGHHHHHDDHHGVASSTLAVRGTPAAAAGGAGHAAGACCVGVGALLPRLPPASLYGPAHHDAAAVEAAGYGPPLHAPAACHGDASAAFPASRWWVKPHLQLLGPGGLSATAAAAKALNVPELTAGAGSGTGSAASYHGYVPVEAASGTGIVGFIRPAAGPLALWLLRDVASDAVLCYHPFYTETAHTLASIPCGRFRPKTPSGDATAVGGGAPPAAGGGAGGDREGDAGAAAAAGGGALPAPGPGSSLRGRHLLSPPVPSTLPVAAEAAVCQSLWQPRPPFAPTFYTMLVISILGDDAAATAATSAGAPATAAVGLLARVIWKYCHQLDDALVMAVAGGWMAHHISNTGWRWLWSEWAPLLTGPQQQQQHHDARVRLLRFLLQRTFELVGPWHYDRIVSSVFPPELAADGAARLAALLAPAASSDTTAVVAADGSAAPAAATATAAASAEAAAEEAFLDGPTIPAKATEAAVCVFLQQDAVTLAQQQQATATTTGPSASAAGSARAASSGDAQIQTNEPEAAAAAAAVAGGGAPAAVAAPRAAAAATAAADATDATGSGGYTGMDKEDVDVMRHTGPSIDADTAAAADAATGDADASAAVASGPSADMCTFAQAVMQQLRARIGDDDMREWLHQAAAAAAAAVSDATGSGVPRGAEQRLFVLCQCLAYHGRANMKHAATLFGRYRGVLTSTHGLPNDDRATTYAVHPPPEGQDAPPAQADELRAHIILAAVYGLWAANRGVASPVVEMLVSTGIVSAAHVVTFAVQPTVAITRFGEPLLARYSPGSAAADAALHRRSVRRALRLSTWQLVAGTLAHAAARADKDAVELYLFRGGKVYDANPEREPDLDVDAAEAKERSIIAAATASFESYLDAAACAVGAITELTRQLQAHATAALGHSATAAGDDDAAAAAAAAVEAEAACEAVRVALAHLRATTSACVPRLIDSQAGCTPLVRAAQASDTLLLAPAPSAAAADDSSAAAAVIVTRDTDGDALLAFEHGASSSTQHAAASGGLAARLRADLPGAVVYASLRWDMRCLQLPSALLRDRDVPVPAHWTTWHL